MDKRKAERFASFVKTEARVPATRVGVTILDISSSGCKLSTQSKLAQVGASIVVSLTDDVVVGGWIVWKSGEVCGVEFDEALNQSFMSDFQAFVK